MTRIKVMERESFFSMKKYFVILVILASIFSSCSMLTNFNESTLSSGGYDDYPDGRWGADSSIYDKAVSKESGVAPLAVHFFSEFAAQSNASNRFKNYDYSWDFDDDDLDVWGTDGRSKNKEKGAVAVHIFENPGVYNVRCNISDDSGIVATENYSISVTDPNDYFSGSNTICVSDTVNNDFQGAPSGSIHVSTDDLSSIVSYAVPGNRILFHRGSSWVTGELDWPDNEGLVVIGAYGAGINKDVLGNFENAPRINVTSGYFADLGNKQNWIFMDLYLIDDTSTCRGFGGTLNMQNLLIKNIRFDGFHIGVGWSHYNDSKLMEKNDIVVASCEINDSYSHGVYGGSERLAIIGNIVNNSKRTHVVRVWQAYRSVISHNIISGASMNNTAGSHALKLHGPGYYPNGSGTATLGTPEVGTSLKSMRTNYTMISGNTFGGSGPWTVAIGPQNAVADERLTNIIFEKNRLHSDFGEDGGSDVYVGAMLWGRDFVARNNIFDGTGSGKSYYGLVVEQRGVEPPPLNVEVYNNTFFRGDTGSGWHIGVRFGNSGLECTAKNNLVSYPFATSATLIDEQSGNVTLSHNEIYQEDLFSDATTVNPVNRNFTLQIGASGGIDSGTIVPVYEDYLGESRIGIQFNSGAFE